jgi:hypothetical protein
MRDTQPLKLEIRKQFGVLQFSLGPVGVPIEWEACGGSRQSLVERLRTALQRVDFEGGQAVVFRGLAYAARETLVATVAFTRNL